MSNYMKFLYAILLTLLCLPQLATGAAPLTVYTVNAPLKYFAERIGGDQVRVVFPASGDVDPAYWIPDAETVVAYQRADLILLNGAGYAKWTAKVSLPRSRTVDTSASLRDRLITSQETLTHSHGPQGTHAHENLAFTTWLDFSLAAEQARAVAEAFSHKRPELREAFQKNFNALQQDLMTLDQEMKQLAAKNPSLPMVVSHPVYDYLGRAYGLNIRSVHWEPDEVPTVARMAELKTLLKDHPATWMVWEGKPDEESRSKLADMGVRSVVFDPCGNVPSSGDFLTTMRNNIDNLGRAYHPQNPY